MTSVLEMSAVDERLKQLRALYHRIEAPPSIHPREQEIRCAMRSIFEDIILWTNEKTPPELKEKISRIEKTFYQVKERLDLRLKEPILPPPESAEDLLEVLEERLSQTRMLYHRIQTHASIEQEAPHILQELREIAQHMETLKKIRPDKREEDVADKIKRLKITLYEVEDFLEEHRESSFLALVLSERTKIYKIQKAEGLIRSKEKVSAMLEKLQKQAEDLDAERPLIKKAILILGIESYVRNL